MAKVSVRPIQVRQITFQIKGTSPLIMHQWTEKAKKEMRDKMQEGKKTKNRDLRDPIQEAIEATYKTEDDEVGIPAMAVKSSFLTAAHKDIGIEKTMVRKALFFICNDPNMILPIDCDEPVVREDMVRVGMGKPDMRYRPMFNEWSCLIKIQFDAELLQVDDILTLANRAGFGTGIGEWRPEKGGDYGRYQVDPSFDVLTDKP